MTTMNFWIVYSSSVNGYRDLSLRSRLQKQLRSRLQS